MYTQPHTHSDTVFYITWLKNTCNSIPANSTCIKWHEICTGSCFKVLHCSAETAATWISGVWSSPANSRKWRRVQHKNLSFCLYIWADRLSHLEKAVRLGNNSIQCPFETQPVWILISCRVDMSTLNKTAMQMNETWNQFPSFFPAV